MQTATRALDLDELASAIAGIAELPEPAPLPGEDRLLIHFGPNTASADRLLIHLGPNTASADRLLIHEGPLTASPDRLLIHEGPLTASSAG